MADFCNICAVKMFGDQIKPDIDVETLAESLTPGYWIQVLCEGCGMNGVIKEEDRTVNLSFYDKEDFGAAFIVKPIDDWRNSTNEPF